MPSEDLFSILAPGFQILSDYSGLWIPPILLIVSWKLWVRYIRIQFISKMKWVLLEVRVPKDIAKSPLAMELVLTNAFYQTGGTGTWVNRWWDGKVRMWFSFEIVSIEGRVYFFIRTPEIYKSLIESQIYAQYPQAEVTEVPDYTKMVPVYTKDGDWNLFGGEFILSKHDAYPIKSYVDYGLPEAIGKLKEEERIDPITPMLEYMGSIGVGEQVWFQILVRASTDKYNDPGTWFGKRGWYKEGKAQLEEIMKDFKGEKDKPAKKQMTKGTQDVINAIERHLNKLGFDCGIRAMYLAKKDNFKATNMQGISNMLKQYGSPDMNSFKLNGDTLAMGFDYPWQDRSGNKLAERKSDLIKAYKARSYFYPLGSKTHHYFLKSYGDDPFVLSSEELATVFHFPGKVSETPSFKRIESKTSEPPANLPI